MVCLYCKAIEWVSDYCLMPNEQLNLARESERLLFITKWAIELIAHLALNNNHSLTLAKFNCSLGN
jgi:hypothetical protein